MRHFDYRIAFYSLLLIIGTLIIASFGYHPRRFETFTGTTDGSGNFSMNFKYTYAVAPQVFVQLSAAADNQFSRVISVSTTAATVNARSRTDVVGLLPTFANLTGASINVVIIEK